MKRKDEIKLDALSRIDDEIIDRNTEKRSLLIHLVYNKGSKIKKRIVVTAISFAAILSLLMSVFLVLSFIPSGQVPVYLGMTVSGEPPVTQNSDALAGNGMTPLSAGSGLGYGFELLANEQDRGFDGNDDGAKRPVEDIIDGSLSVEGSAEQMYYANKNQDIYITIHISNPDKFEILSFTLNGDKYTSYMFEEGSDLENLVLKVNVGDKEGILEYTIDAIKYVDGTEIKDVVMEGDRTVKVGVYPEDQPDVTVSDEVVGINKLTFSALVEDPKSLIEASEGKVKTVILDNDTLIGEQDVLPGERTEVTFDGLRPDTEYRYAIIAYYDALDGVGFTSRILSEKEIRTQGVVAFDSVSIGQESFSFALEWNELHTDKKVENIALYLGEEKVADISPETLSISRLLSNTEYTAVISYLSLGNMETVSLTFTTQSKAVPTLELSEGNITQSSIAFDASITDPDGVGKITKIELLHGNDAPISANLTARSFDGLLSDNEYTVKATYIYDLNDGNGEHEIIKSIDMRTQSKAVPTLVLSKGEVTQSSIAFDVSVTDPDGVGAITKLELLHGNDAPMSANLTARSFDGLLSDNTYTVKVTYIYDLNDGSGKHEITKRIDMRTQSKAVPTLELSEGNITQSSIAFGLNYTDPDGVGAITKLELLHGNDAPISANLTARSFDGLLSDNEYTVKVTYIYDLNDGSGKHEIIKNIDMRTQSKAVPVGQIESVESTLYTISGSYVINDPDSTVTSEKIELYLGDKLIESKVGGNFKFSSLDYYKYYTVKLTYTYDLGDGTGSYTVTDSESLYTQPYLAVTSCDIANTDPVSKGDTIYVMLGLDNPCGGRITQIKINGNYYSTSSVSTDTVFVEILYYGQFKGGDTSFAVEEIKMALGGAEYTVKTENSPSASIFICGRIEVLGFEYVNENFEPIDYAFSEDTVYMLLTVDDPTGYNIDSVTVGHKITDVRKIDDSRYYFEAPSRGAVWLSTVEYGNSDVSLSETGLSMNALLVDAGSRSTVKYISTPEDLLDMDDGYYYELTCDIDLSGMNWQGGLFYGTFNGNGYSIKNMTYVGVVPFSSTPVIGLFCSGTGIIENLNMENVKILTTNINSCGAIVGDVGFDGLIVRSCTVDESSVISCDGKAGGIVGLMTWGRIENCTNKAKIDSTEMSAGGIVGSVIGIDDKGVTIFQCSNYGDVTGNGSVGGIVGGGTQIGTNAIECTNNGKITGKYYVGGIAGIGTAMGCINNGAVLGTQTTTGGIVGLGNATDCTDNGEVIIKEYEE